MPNIGVVLKEEIARLARKELRRSTVTLQKSSTQHRRDIAALKREVADLRKKVALLGRRTLKQSPAPPAGESAGKVRFTAKGLRSQRERLGLAAAEYAKLVGVSTQSIYNWERQTASPRKEQVAVLAALRGLGKKEARARLEQLGAKKQGKGRKKSR